MSDNVLIALIIAACAVAVIWILRDKIKGTKVDVSKEGVKVDLETHGTPVASASGNEITGDENSLTSRNGGQIKQNKINGNKNKITISNS